MQNEQDNRVANLLHMSSLDNVSENMAQQLQAETINILILLE